MDVRDESEELRKENTASSSKEQNETYSINNIENDMDGECETIARNKELIVFGLGLGLFCE